MKDAPFEFSAVPPNKLAEARRRATLVADYAKIERPTRAKAHEYATRLGISLRLFYNLVKIYRERGAVTVPTSSGLADRKLRMDPRVDAIIMKVIRDKGADASAAAILKDVQACCDGAGLPYPSIMPIMTRVRRERRKGSGSSSFPPLVVDRCALALNVEHNGPVAAWLTAVLHTPSATVLGYHVSAGEAGPHEAAAALSHALSRPPTELRMQAPDTAITLFPDADPAWRALEDILSSQGLIAVGPIVDRPTTGAATFRLLGDRIGRVALRPRLKANIAAPSGGRAVDIDLARSVIDASLRERVKTSAGICSLADYVSDVTAMEDLLVRFLRQDPSGDR